MNPLRLGIILFSLTTVLCACGGGGGGSTSPSLITYDTMVSEVSAIEQSFNSLLMTDILRAQPGVPEMVRWQRSCERKECTVWINGLPFRMGAFSGLEFSDPADDYRFFTGSGGVKMVDIRGISKDESGGVSDFKNLGGWLDYSAFAIQLESSRVSGVSDGVDLREVFLGAYSLGQATGRTPEFGNATWTGAMVGGDTSSTANRGNRFQGDATLTFNLSQSDLDVAFTNIRDVDAGHRYQNITWQNIPVTSGSFSTGIDENSIDGQFYGPNHEEVGGVFERNQIAGAFGAKR